MLVLRKLIKPFHNLADFIHALFPFDHFTKRCDWYTFSGGKHKSELTVMNHFASMENIWLITKRANLTKEDKYFQLAVNRDKFLPNFLTGAISELS